MVSWRSLLVVGMTTLGVATGPSSQSALGQGVNAAAKPGAGLGVKKGGGRAANAARNRGRHSAIEGVVIHVQHNSKGTGSFTIQPGGMHYHRNARQQQRHVRFHVNGQTTFQRQGSTRPVSFKDLHRGERARVMRGGADIARVVDILASQRHHRHHQRGNRGARPGRVAVGAAIAAGRAPVVPMPNALVRGRLGQRLTLNQVQPGRQGQRDQIEDRRERLRDRREDRRERLERARLANRHPLINGRKSLSAARRLDQKLDRLVEGGKGQGQQTVKGPGNGPAPKGPSMKPDRAPNKQPNNTRSSPKRTTSAARAAGHAGQASHAPKAGGHQAPAQHHAKSSGASSHKSGGGKRR